MKCEGQINSYRKQLFASELLLRCHNKQVPGSKITFEMEVYVKHGNTVDD